MQSEKEHAKLGRERLQRIIEMLKSTEERSLDPFLIDVNDIITVIKEYFPDWESPEDLVLDAETINRLASVIRLQSEWVRHRSTSLYTDPFLLEEKIMNMGKDDLVRVFAKAWHPIVELEQISLHSLAEAIKYWESLLPMKERWKELAPTEVESGVATREELVAERILSDRAFSEELENFWQELKDAVKQKGENEKIGYWHFIGAETYEETVHRAFMTSFLVTYGYATLEIYPLREETYVKPYEKPMTKISSKQLVSVPIAITSEDWMKWKKGELK